MTYLLWIIPPILFMGSTYWFNVKKTRVITRDFWITWALDSLMAYTLSSLVLIRLVSNTSWLLILYVVFFLGSGLARFWHGNVQSQDLDLEIETLKNNVVLFGTTFLPFLLAVYLLDAQAAWLQYLLALVIAAAVFAVSIPIKVAVGKLVSYLYTQTQLISDLTLTIVFYVVGSTSLVIVLILTVTTMYQSPVYNIELGESFLADSLVEGVSIDWANATIVDLDVSRSNRMILLIREDDGDEYLIRYFFSDVEDDYAEVLNLPHNRPSELANDPYIARFGTSYIDFMTPTEGLYIFTTSDISVVPESVALQVNFINVGFCQGCFLVNNEDGTYDLWNSVFQVIETIPTAPTNTEYVIISRYLFVDDGETYTMYDDDSLVFSKVLGDPTYDPEKNILYTMDTTEEGFVHVSLQQVGGDVQTHTFKVDSGQLHIPLFDTYIYDPVELFANRNTTNFAKDLTIHSYQMISGEVFSILSYDPDRYVAVPNLIRSRAAVLELSYNRDNLLFKQGSLSLLVTVDDTITTKVVRFLIILSSMLVFIPITNYAKYTTIVDYDHKVTTPNQNKKPQS